MRSFLVRLGPIKGDPSNFIGEAAKGRRLDQTIAETRSKFAAMPADELQQMIDEAVEAVRQPHQPG